MDIGLLKTLREVHRTRHVGQAADNQDRTQPAISARQDISPMPARHRHGRRCSKFVGHFLQDGLNNQCRKDTKLSVHDNFLHEHVGQARGQGAGLRSGETAVQIAPVRKIAGLINKAIHVDDRDGDQITA